MNKVMLMGRLTADPEIRATQDGTKVGTYTLAVDRRGAREQTADFIRCQAWDRRAEFAEKYLKKGTKILITGRIQTGSYTARDGKKVYTTDVVIEDQEFAESKQSEEKTEERPYAPDDGFMNVENLPHSTQEDLPFN